MSSELIQARSLPRKEEATAGKAITGWIRQFYARYTQQVFSVGAIVVVLLVWQLGSGSLLNAYYLSKPTEIVRQIVLWSADGYLFKHLAVTLLNTATGYFLSVIFGIGLALLFVSVPLLDRIFFPYIYALFSLPKVVLAPLLMLWFGVGALSVMFMSFITGFFMVFFNVYSGMRNVNPALLNVARLMGANTWTVAMKVRLPASRAFVALGMHQGLVYAFHGAIVGEMVSSPEGLGYALVYAASEMDANGVLAILLVLAVMTVFFLHVLGKMVNQFKGSVV